MTVSRAKGDKGAADQLFSRLVRSRLRCERCGNQGADIREFHTAHIVRRRYSATRCVEENAWCACPQCHRLVDEWPGEFIALVDRTIGRARYEELCRDANEGPPVSSGLWWAAERERLTARCKELGIDTRRKIA